MASEQEEQVVMFRNFVVIFLMWSLIAVSCLYIIGFLTTTLVYGLQTSLQVIKIPIQSQVFYFANVLYQCWNTVIAAKGAINLFNANYFLIKLLVGAFIPIGIYGTVVYIFREPIMEWRPFKAPESAQGNAHWATKAEIKKAQLTSTKGLLLGKHNGKFLISPLTNFQHVLLFAPTGSGKGVGFVIPNLLFWESSVICHDVKLENYELTSGFRGNKLKQKVFLWNPADQDGITHCYNPMDWMSRDIGNMVDDVQKIAKFLLPQEDFWQSEARSLLTGIMLYLLVAEDRPASLGEVLRIIRSDDVAYNLAVVLDTMGEKIHPVAYMNLAAFLQKADKERSGVISTASSSLELWSNPLVDAATAKSHFNLGLFRTIPHSLFVGIAPNNLVRLKPLLQIFYQQCTTIFTQKMPNKKKEKFGVLMLLDEFPTLGKMEEIKAGIAYYRGYMVKLFLIIQDTEQLKATYEASGMNSFLSNSTFRITYAANNVETAKLISDLLGNKTVINTNYSRPKYLDLNPGARSVSVSKGARALLLPQEVINLPKDEQILLIEASAPIRCKKIFYYKERLFTSRLLEKTPVPKQEPYIAKKKPKEGEGGEQPPAGAA